MPIRVECTCGKIFMVKDQFAGKKGRCPACKNILVIPGPKEKTADTAPPPAPPPAAKEAPHEDTPAAIQPKIHVSSPVHENDLDPGSSSGTIKKPPLPPKKEDISTVETGKSAQAKKWIKCPKCGTEQLTSKVCNNCGIVFAKFKPPPPPPKKKVADPTDIAVPPELTDDEPAESDEIVDCPKCGLVQQYSPKCKKCGANLRTRLVKQKTTARPVAIASKRSGRGLRTFFLFLVLIVLLGFLGNLLKPDLFTTVKQKLGLVSPETSQQQQEQDQPIDVPDQQVIDYATQQGPSKQLDQSLNQLTGKLGTAPDAWGDADSAMNNRNFQKALNLYTQLAQTDKSPELQKRIAMAYCGLGLEFYASDDYKSALNNFQSALQYDKTSWESMAGLGRVYWKLNDRDAATRYFLMAIDLKPDDFSIRRDLGVLYYQKGFIPDAINQLEQAYIIEPREPVTLETLGLCYYNQKEYPKSTDLLRRLLVVEVIGKEDQFEYQRRTQYLDMNKFMRKILEYKLGASQAENVMKLIPRLTAGQLQIKMQEMLGIDSKLLVLILTYERENAMEKGYSRFQGEHFHVSYDREKLASKVDFGSLIQDYLRDAYRTIGQDFDYFPEKTVSVSVSPEYRWTNPHFRELGEKINIPIYQIFMEMFSTNVPESSKMAFVENQRRLLNIPMQNEYQLRDFQENFEDYLLDEMKKIVFHEYTHFIIYNLTNGNEVPRWLHEGLAQYEEPRRASAYRTEYSAWVHQNNFTSLGNLDSYFFGDESRKKKPTCNLC